jgi:hypothetical protein
VTRVQESARVKSPMQPRWVFYSLRNYIFYVLWICKMYIVLWIWTNYMMKDMFWIIWLVWLCSIISMMFKNWCKSEMCRIELKCLSVLRLGFKLFKIVWELVMLKLFMFYEKTMIWMFSKYLMKDRICLVLREHDLATTWFYSMIQ